MTEELKFDRPPEEDDAPERKPRGQSERSQRRQRADIRERLTTIFERLADSLEGRGDAELAAVIREDSRAMVGGLVSVTRRVPAAAGVIVGGLAVLEPLIAFGRVLRLLLRRAGERREAAAAAWEEPQDDEPAAPEPEPAEDEPAIAEPWKLT